MWLELDYELSGDVRPSRDHFVRLLQEAVELHARVFWDDDTLTPTVDDESGIRTIQTRPVPPYIFPPGVFYAVEQDPDTVVVLSVEFDWDFWKRLEDHPDD